MFELGVTPRPPIPWRLPMIPPVPWLFSGEGLLMGPRNEFWPWLGFVRLMTCCCGGLLPPDREPGSLGFICCGCP